MPKKGRTKKEEFHSTVLDADIIEDEILPRLPVKSLVRFRCVNKHWYALFTTDSTFIQKHLARSIQNNDFIIDLKSYIQHESTTTRGFYLPVDGNFDKLVNIELPNRKRWDDLFIYGSSNGLICISNPDLFTCLWNPATRQQMILPPCRMKPKGFCFTSLGFGFHPVINDYKVVILGSHIKMGVDEDGLPTMIEVEVYSLNTNSWKKLGVFPYGCSDYISKSILNGVVHWIALGKYELILSFDLTDEVFREIPLPDEMNPVGVTGMCLETFRGCLSLVVRYKTRELDYWVMKEYNVKESWYKLFNVDLRICSRHTIQFLKNNDVLLEIYPECFASYNLECRQLQALHFPREFECPRIFDAHPFVESLVPVMAANNRLGGRHAYGLRSQKKKKKEVLEIN